MITPENIFDFSTAHETCHGNPGVCEVGWQVPANLPYLNGHFPDRPIVPAVAMIDASIVLLQQFLKQPALRLRAVKQAKFMAPLTVGDQVQIASRAGRDGAWDIDWKNPEGQFVARLSLIVV
jgi:3-hydroxymyristoyl/3-hydroxydecanoyl-(acyl carrier protein) dehydratase